jgi:hypothetical protein
VGGKKICLKDSERTVEGKQKTKMDSIDTIAALVLGRRRAMFGMKSTGDQCRSIYRLQKSFTACIKRDFESRDHPVRSMALTMNMGFHKWRNLPSQNLPKKKTFFSQKYGRSLVTQNSIHVKDSSQ